MARTVKWTNIAADDLFDAAEFIAKDSPFYAMALVREARAAALSLSKFADRGRIVPESNTPEIRELFIKSYRLIYQTTSDHVFILAFIHGARDLATIWQQRNG
jgi:plasmid stabilization system protein ParE